MSLRNIELIRSACKEHDFINSNNSKKNNSEKQLKLSWTKISLVKNCEVKELKTK